MFFASIFSYSQRKRLCAAAYQKTRQNLADARRRARAAARAARHPLRHGPPRRSDARRHRRADRSAPAQRRRRGAAAACGRPRATSRTRSTISSAGSPAAALRCDASSARAGALYIRDPVTASAGHGGKKTSPPHPRTDPRDEPRAVQSRRRAARHDGGHRRRDEHQPGQSLLPLRQQGRDRLRAVRGATRRGVLPLSPTRRPPRSTSTTSGSGCTCCSSGCGNTGSSTATSTSSRRATRKLGTRFGALLRKGAATVIQLCRRHGRTRRDARVGARDRGARAQRRARRHLLAVVRPGSPGRPRRRRRAPTPAAPRTRCSRCSRPISSATRARYLDRLAADYL